MQMKLGVQVINKEKNHLPFLTPCIARATIIDDDECDSPNLNSKRISYSRGYHQTFFNAIVLTRKNNFGNSRCVFRPTSTEERETEPSDRD